MKKEVVVSSAIVALLSSLSAGSDFKVNEIKPAVDGKIIASKDIADKIDGNKKIGKDDKNKFNLICGWSCAKPGQANKTPIFDGQHNIGKATKNIGQRP